MTSTRGKEDRKRKEEQERKRKEDQDRKRKEEQEKKRKEEQEEKRVQQATAAASTSKQEMSDVQLFDSVQMETEVDITSLFWMLGSSFVLYSLCVDLFACWLLILYLQLDTQGDSGYYIWSICHQWSNYTVLPCLR